MTNREDDGDTTRDPRLAALLAVHLVSQVLDEAYVIANAAYDSGQPWRTMSMFKNFKSSKLSDTDYEDVSFAAPKGDTDISNENKMEQVANIVATSTPQKVTEERRRPEADTGFIGQGDEDLEMNEHELTKSTSMFLNHLFDMSEVERVVICDDTDLAPCQPEPDDLLTQAMTKIMESYINTALGMAYDQNVQLNNTEVPKESSSTEHSEYSFLADAFTVDISRDVAFYIHDDANIGENNNFSTLHLIESVEITELNNEPNPEESIERNDVARFEHAYLTMNRDYDQCSDDDADPVLQDPKGMTLQEVELLTANTSEENLSVKQDQQEEQSTCKQRELTATSAVSATVSGSKKSSLVHRCRTQGARLLACIRGWWRRKTPGKRKEARTPGTLRGICPLSPDARRRATSLLDQRLLRSPSPSRSVVWKFNTVNESLVNSTRWKEYTFDTQPDGGGEY